MRWRGRVGGPRHVLLRLCCVHSDGGSVESFVSHFSAEFQPESDKDQARSQKNHCSSSPPPPLHLLLLYLFLLTFLIPLLLLSLFLLRCPPSFSPPPRLPPPSPPPPPTDLYLRMQSCKIKILFLNMKVNSEDFLFSKRGSKKKQTVSTVFLFFLRHLLLPARLAAAFLLFFF